MDNFISVIICTHNRYNSLKCVLDSLICQENDGSFKYEIIIVDNNSKDQTKELINSYASKFPNRLLRYLFEQNQGLSYARNRGIKEAKGGIIAFTDDDVIIDNRWLLNIWKCFNAYDCDAAGGMVLPIYPTDCPKWIKESISILHGLIVIHDYGKKTRNYNEPGMVPFIGANMAFKKDCFIQCGSFRTDLGMGTGSVGEDVDLFRRLQKSNKKIYYCGDILENHKVDIERMRYKNIIKWYFSLGKYEVRKIDSPKIKHLNFYFGIPRYLYKKVLTDFIRLFFHIANKNKFLLTLKNFSTEIGELAEWREQYKYGKS